MRDSSSIMMGRGPVTEAFKGEITIERIFILRGAADGPINTIIKKARQRGIRPEFVDKSRLDEMTNDGNHQGVVAFISEYRYHEVYEIMELARSRGEDPFVVFLDGIEDPQNLGAIIRSAHLLGAHGVVIPKRNSATLTASAAKASAGAVNHVMVARVANLKNTVEELKKEGMWFGYADAKGTPMHKQNLKGPLGLIIGGEDKGVGRLLSEHCDFAISIPMVPVSGNVGSFNAACAFSIIGSEVLRQRSGSEGI